MTKSDYGHVIIVVLAVLTFMTAVSIGLDVFLFSCGFSGYSILYGVLAGFSVIGFWFSLLMVWIYFGEF